MAYSQPMTSALPDPDYDATFYQDVPSKRLIAWVIDVALISMIVGILTLLSAFIAVLFLPLVFACVSFLYRWFSIAARSATPGMRFMAIELRGPDGQPLDNTAALLHTAGYFISVVTFPLQLISIFMMLTTARKQGLTDTVLGTAAINRTTR